MNGSGVEHAGIMTGSKRSSGSTRAATAVLLALLAVIAAGLIAFNVHGLYPLWVIGVGGVLSSFGLFLLLALVSGVLTFRRAALREGLIEEVAEAIGEACVVTDEKGRKLYANAAFFKLAAAAGSGRSGGFEYLYAGYPDVADAIYRLAQAARERRPALEEIRLPAGSNAPGGRADHPALIRISVSPLERDGRTLTLWRHADISQDRLRQEQAFSQLQHIINSLDNAPAGFFAAEPSGRISYINATLAGWLGLDLDATAAGTLTLDTIATESGASVLRSISLRQGESRTDVFDIDLKTRKGELLPVRVIQRSDSDAQGILQPARALVLAKQALPDESSTGNGHGARLARFINAAPIGIAEVDRSSVITNANPAFIALSPRAKRGEPLSALVVEGQEAKLAQAILAASKNSGEVHSVDVTLNSQPPRLVQFLILHMPEPASGYVVYALDTTENKALEVQLGQAQKMQAIGQLAGGVAHDFNNVLTAIIGFSDLLLTRHKATDPAFADIMNIKQNANRAANLVRQLLAFSRRQTLRPEVMSLTDVLSDLGNLLRRLLGEKIDLRITHGRDLWLVKVDLNQFEQTVINLAVNARDAMPTGGALSVRTSNVTFAESSAVNPLMPPGEYVLCEIEDTGTGIPAEIRDKIWEPFFSTKEVGKGTGLGLSTVYGFVKQTGGFIFCDSEVGRGTVFRMYLPRHKADAPVASAEARDEKKEAKRADLTGKGTILRALKSRGYTVLEADSGERAIEVVEAGERIDLILSDVVMPNMDGPTLLKELRRRGNMTKVIFISGYAEDAFQKNLEGQTDFAFLPKPFTLKQLAETVKDVMG
jgi:two-component system cell cycle sensor histidine kinase/response regulator CckA